MTKTGCLENNYKCCRQKEEAVNEDTNSEIFKEKKKR
jgi:hypothetical protein